MERHISFIVPGKQVYIPALIINLNEFIDLQVKKKDHLSPVSQFLLLYHLSKQSLEGISFGRVAHLINYSSMSVTRVVKELREKQL
jgi:DNA-binding MarR family transcriptional regulator